MITINGQKMARSLGNFILLDQLFSGDHPMLEQAYSPMTIRFFILQAHYRSTVDFSNEALKAAGKGLQKLFNGISTLGKLKPSDKSTIDAEGLSARCYEAMNDDLNTPVVLSHLFEAVRYINSAKDETGSLDEAGIQSLKKLFNTFVFEIMGLRDESMEGGDEKLTGDLMDIIISLRQDARSRKDFGTSDKIRDELKKAGVMIKDRKDGVEWERE